MSAAGATSTCCLDQGDQVSAARTSGWSRAHRPRHINARLHLALCDSLYHTAASLRVAVALRGAVPVGARK